MSQLPDIGVRSVDQQRIASTLHNTLELAFSGHLPSIVTKVVDPKNLAWIERTTIDLEGSSATFSITPTFYPKYFRCFGTWTLRPLAGPNERSRRLIEATMKVTSPMPFVNGQVERAIVSGLRERLEREPALVEAWLQARPGEVRPTLGK